MDSVILERVDQFGEEFLSIFQFFNCHPVITRHIEDNTHNFNNPAVPFPEQRQTHYIQYKNKKIIFFT